MFIALTSVLTHLRPCSFITDMLQGILELLEKNLFIIDE